MLQIAADSHARIRQELWTLFKCRCGTSALCRGGKREHSPDWSGSLPCLLLKQGSAAQDSNFGSSALKTNWGANPNFTINKEFQGIFFFLNYQILTFLQTHPREILTHTHTWLLWKHHAAHEEADALLCWRNFVPRYFPDLQLVQLRMDLCYISKTSKKPCSTPSINHKPGTRDALGCCTSEIS